MDNQEYSLFNTPEEKSEFILNLGRRIIKKGFINFFKLLTEDGITQEESTVLNEIFPSEDDKNNIIIELKKIIDYNEWDSE